MIVELAYKYIVYEQEEASGICDTLGEAMAYAEACVAGRARATPLRIEGRVTTDFAQRWIYDHRRQAWVASSGHTANAASRQAALVAC